MRNSKILSKELLLAGAKQPEADRLLEVAGQLSQLKTDRSTHTQPRYRQRLKHWPVFTLSMATIAGMLLGGVLVAYSQTSLPGSWLYSTKRASERIAVAVDPSYRATLMMRRSQEVEDLVRRHSNEHVVLATLADYRVEAAAYKSDNYAAFEFCKNNLEQAANIAPSPERAAIANTLSSLQA
jgi:hypothetical protein